MSEEEREERVRSAQMRSRRLFSNNVWWTDVATETFLSLCQVRYRGIRCSQVRYMWNTLTCFVPIFILVACVPEVFISLRLFFKSHNLHLLIIYSWWNLESRLHNCVNKAARWQIIFYLAQKRIRSLTRLKDIVRTWSFTPEMTIQCKVAWRCFQS